MASWLQFVSCMHALNDIVGAVGNTVSLHANERLLLVVSFDGVLAKYEPDPRDAHVKAERLIRLQRLQQIPGVVVAVMSGRSLCDLRRRIDLGEHAYYIALHGMEIVGPGYARSCDEVSRSFRGRMREVAHRVRSTLGNVPGVRLECKGPVLALHTRDAAPEHVVWSRFQFLGAAAELVNADIVRAFRGHDVLELLPNVGCSRADALCAVRARVEAQHGQPVFTVYVGGDLADDDSVRAIDDHGVAVVVGQRTHTAHHIEPGQVDTLLEALSATRLGSSGVPLEALP